MEELDILSVYYEQSGSLLFTNIVSFNPHNTSERISQFLFTEEETWLESSVVLPNLFKHSVWEPKFVPSLTFCETWTSYLNSALWACFKSCTMGLSPPRAVERIKWNNVWQVPNTVSSHRQSLNPNVQTIICLLEKHTKQQMMWFYKKPP